MAQGTEDMRWRKPVLATVVAAHALLLWLLVQDTVRTPQPVLERLTLLYLPPPTPRLPDSQAAVATAPARLRRAAPRETHADQSSGGAPSLQTPAIPSPPAVDWTAERDRVADSTARDVWKHLSQRCRDAEALHIYPPECHRYVAPEPWEPEEKRFGLAGPLPYVRLGHCVVGLGFWGCALGKPEANGRVFEGLRDPDRPDSVPGNGGYQPAPDARERLH